MKRLLLSCILLLTVMVSASGSFGADLQRKLDAFDRGDYATALKEWNPLAEQGVTPANTPSEQPQNPPRYHPKSIVSQAKLAFPSAQLGEEKT